ncbi:hypothetical protein BGZ46_003062, partial [Entomortierella lignicola]
SKEDDEQQEYLMMELMASMVVVAVGVVDDADVVDAVVVVGDDGYDIVDLSSLTAAAAENSLTDVNYDTGTVDYIHYYFGIAVVVGVEAEVG